jgi:cell division protein FtsB
MITMNRKKKSIRMFITGLLAIMLLLGIVPRAKSIVELSSQKKALQQEKARLEMINSERSKVLSSLDTPEAIERIAREKLGMVKNGEKVIVKVVNHK